MATKIPAWSASQSTACAPPRTDPISFLDSILIRYLPSLRATSHDFRSFPSKPKLRRLRTGGAPNRPSAAYQSKSAHARTLPRETAGTIDFGCDRGPLDCTELAIYDARKPLDLRGYWSRAGSLFESGWTATKCDLESPESRGLKTSTCSPPRDQTRRSDPSDRAARVLTSIPLMASPGRGPPNRAQASLGRLTPLLRPPSLPHHIVAAPSPRQYRRRSPA